MFIMATEDVLTDEDCDYLFKIVIIGESGTGKSCLLSRYCNNEFDPDQQPTIGVKFATSDIEMDGSKVRAQIWDASGRACYRGITSAYYKGAVGLLLVYDATRRETFDRLSKWLAEIRVHGTSDVVILLVANKCDLLPEDTENVPATIVTSDEGFNLAENEGIFSFIETSAANSTNVEAAFSILITEVFRQQHHATLQLSKPEYR